MSDRVKEIILKTLIVVGFGFMIMIVPVGILFAIFGLDEKTAMPILYTMLFSCFGTGILFIILLFIFGGIKPKPVKAEKYPLLFDSYDELSEFLDKRLTDRKYKKQKSVRILSDVEVTLYIKPSWSWELECFTIVRAPELTDKLLEGDANDCVTDILNEYYGGRVITDAVNMISVFCVDRITPSLQELVNSNIEQGFKNGRLPVGISFGGKNVYIARQIDGFAIAKYKRMRKEFIDIMDLKEIKK